MPISSVSQTEIKRIRPLEHCGPFNTLNSSMEHKGRFWGACFNM